MADKSRVHTNEQISAFSSELTTQTDRACGIVAAAVVENVLGTVVQRRLVPLSNKRREALFGRMRPLSTFSAKIELGFALGLYNDDLHRVLDMIRDVRNYFAHHMEISSFGAEEIAKLIRNAQPPSTPKDGTLRQTFMMCVVTTLLLLYALAREDIEIKPLAETNADLFVNAALALHVWQHAQASNPTASAELPISDPETP